MMGYGDSGAAHHYRSLRLQGYDYSSSGAYFVTVCTAVRRSVFGQVMDGNMRLNDAGRVVEEEWRRTPDLRPDVVLDGYVIMPNHMHGILFLPDRDGKTTAESHQATHVRRPPPSASQTLGAIIRGFKGAATRRLRLVSEPHTVTIWQSNYYDHIIRTEEALDRIRAYIADNPRRWEDDKFYCEQ